MGRLRRKPVAQAPPGDSVWQVPARFNFTRDVVEMLAADPLRPALTFVDRDGVIDRMTFAEIAAEANRWAALLRSRGLVPGDRLLVFVTKTPAWHTILLGALKAGLVSVPCSEMLRAPDLAFRAEQAGAKLVVAQRSLAPELTRMDAEIDIVFVEDAVAELQAHSAVQPTYDTRSADTAFILYTSGTTRHPKGAVHTHGYAWAARLQAEHWLDARPGDLVWCTAGTGWAKSIWNVLLGPWSRGAELVLHDGGFDVDQRFDLLHRLGVTVLCQAPTEYRLMAKLPHLARFDLSRVRHAVSAGEPLNPEVINAFRDAFDLTIYDGYGQTENTLLVANARGTDIRPGSMGLPTPGHGVAVIDAEGNESPVGEEGDIALRGRPPSLFAGYWDAPEETAVVFRGDWYLTGDRAWRDEDGYFWFTGRADDVILSAAYRIGPFEVESALLEHPAVAESAVVGKPDADRGEIVKAFVVLRPDYAPSNNLVTELQTHVKAVTAPYKYPREIEFVTDLPKTASGKIRRAELRARERNLAPDDTAATDALAAAQETAAAEAKRVEETESAALEASRLDGERAADEAKRVAEEETRAEEARVDQARATSEVMAEPHVAAAQTSRAARKAEQERLKEAGKQRKADEKRLREEQKSAAEQARRDEVEARHTAEARAKEDERLRKEEEKRLREQEKTAAEQARRDEVEARRQAKTNKQRLPASPPDEVDDDEADANPALVSRLRAYGKRDNDDSDGDGAGDAPAP